MFNLLLKSAGLVVVIAIFALFQPAQAQTKVQQLPNTYSLEDCIRIALETNPQVKIS